MSFSYGTPILTPDGLRAIQTLVPGDKVSAASITVARSAVKLAWSDKLLTFSSGTPPGRGSRPMMFVQCGASHVACTSDTLFLLSSGKLKRAGKLTPSDTLVDQNGAAMTIVEIRVISWEGGVHDLATGPYRGTPDGHLVLANGVVCGDYPLQIQDLGDLLEGGPAIGTPEYGAPPRR